MAADRSLKHTSRDLRPQSADVDPEAGAGQRPTSDPDATGHHPVVGQLVRAEGLLDGRPWLFRRSIIA